VCTSKGVEKLYKRCRKDVFVGFSHGNGRETHLRKSAEGAIVSPRKKEVTSATLATPAGHGSTRVNLVMRHG